MFGSRGRHRGKFAYKVPWPRGLFPGFHRGVYEPKLEWEWKVCPGLLNTFSWTTASTPFWVQDPPGTFTLARDDGSALIISGPSIEEEVRDVVRDELTSPPIFSGLRFGEFGDSAFDLVDHSVLRGPVSA